MTDLKDSTAKVKEALEEFKSAVSSSFPKDIAKFVQNDDIDFEKLKKEMSEEDVNVLKRTVGNFTRKIDELKNIVSDANKYK